jgi:hypothetical protein
MESANVSNSIVEWKYGRDQFITYVRYRTHAEETDGGAGKRRNGE